MPQIILNPARIDARVHTHPPEHRTAQVNSDSEFLHASLASSMVMPSLQSSRGFSESSNVIGFVVFVFVFVVSFWSCTPVASVDVAAFAFGCRPMTYGWLKD